MLYVYSYESYLLAPGSPQHISQHRRTLLIIPCSHEAFRLLQSRSHKLTSAQGLPKIHVLSNSEGQSRLSPARTPAGHEGFLLLRLNTRPASFCFRKHRLQRDATHMNLTDHRECTSWNSYQLPSKITAKPYVLPPHAASLCLHAITSNAEPHE